MHKTNTISSLIILLLSITSLTTMVQSTSTSSNSNNNPYYFKVKHQSFPSSPFPGAGVYFPKNYDFSVEKINVITYIHGWKNCIENIGLPLNAGKNCSVGQPVRSTYNLFQQLDNANVQAILLMVETKYDQPSSDPGDFQFQNQFDLYMDEVLSNINSHFKTPKKVSDIARMMLMSHSGGYILLIDIAKNNPIASRYIKEIVLFDSLYGNINDYQNWFSRIIPHLGHGGYANTSYNNVYTDFGGTKDNSLAQEQTFKTLLSNSQKSNQLLFDNTVDTLQMKTYFNYSVIFKRSGLQHDQVPAYYFLPFVKASFGKL